MKTLFICYKTDAWHSYNSRDVIAVCDSKDRAIQIIHQHAEEHDEPIRYGSDASWTLRNLNQTQGYEGDGEYMFEEIYINSFV